MKTANGFANPETENVTLWLENYRPHYDAVNKLQKIWFTVPMDHGGERGECLQTFAAAIRSFCARRWPTMATPDGHSLAAVDWPEIAAHWVEP